MPTASPEGQAVYPGIGQHAGSLVVVAQENACVPKPARRFVDLAKFHDWIKELQGQGRRVLACYEAGPCGYWLCRERRGQGVECLVVAPRKRAVNGKVKTDARDARALCERLFQWASGRKNAFTLVKLPGEAEERRRQLARTRERMITECKRENGIGWFFHGSSWVLRPGNDKKRSPLQRDDADEETSLTRFMESIQ